MAKKQTTTTYKQIMADVRKGNFAPIYLLQGSENWFSDTLANAIRSTALSEEDRDFNLDTFYGSDLELDKVIAVARSYPVMAPRRVVEMREVQGIRDTKRVLEKLVPYAERALDTTILVITYNYPDDSSGLGATHPLVKAIKDNGGVVLTSPRPAPWHLTKYIDEYASDKNLKIDRNAQEMLAEFIGADLSRLYGTIDKLEASLPSGQRTINAETVEKLTGYSKDFNVNELVNALSRRDYARCMLIVDYFKRNPNKNPVQMITGSLFNFYSQLTVCYWSKDRSPAGLRTLLGSKVSEYRCKLLAETMPRYNARACIRIIHYLRELDCHSKGIGSNQNAHALLQEFIFKALTA